jgi:hypothetical protein
MQRITYRETFGALKRGLKLVNPCKLIGPVSAQKPSSHPVLRREAQSTSLAPIAGAGALLSWCKSYRVKSILGKEDMRMAIRVRCVPWPRVEAGHARLNMRHSNARDLGQTAL